MALDISKIRKAWNRTAEKQKLNTVSFDILPESVRLMGTRLLVELDGQRKKQMFINEMLHLFQATEDDLDLANGMLCCDKNIDVDSAQISRLNKTYNKTFMSLSENPVIDGTITMVESPLDFLTKMLNEMQAEYSVDKNERLQISVKTMRTLSKALCKTNSIASLSEKASAVFMIIPNPVFFIKKWLPSEDIYHKVNSYSKECDGVPKFFSSRYIVLKNRCFTEPALKVLNDLFDVKLNKRELSFKVDRSCLESFDFKKCKYKFPKNKDGLFVYTIQAKDDPSTYNEDESKQKHYDLIDDCDYIENMKSIFNRVFGAENVEYSNAFYYKYDCVKYQKEFLPAHNYKDFYDSVYNTLKDDKTTISQRNSSIGIDFLWKETTTQNLILDIYKKCPVVDVLYSWGEHRCNVEVENNYVPLEELERKLKLEYPSIQTVLHKNEGSISFVQEYSTQEYADKVKQSLEEEFADTLSAEFKLQFNEQPTYKNKYHCSIDDGKKLSEYNKMCLERLCGSDFYAGELCIGKLIRVDYPELLFDMSNENRTAIADVFNNREVSSISSNITNETEKVSPLRAVLERISSVFRHV